MKLAIPSQVTVKELKSSRYSDNRRPQSWDKRVTGIDTVVTNEAGEIALQSDGSQSPPLPGWGIVLTGGDDKAGYSWTLYQLPRETLAQ